MSKIKLLDKNTRDQIAAGEVAERPAFIIKELVENSLDADASDIRITLKEGGIDGIRIIDNGTGIDKEDLPLAFTRHATSKLNVIGDLDSLITMGFRGEALASIAAVSKVKVISKTDKESKAYSMEICGGEIGEIIPTGGNQGTEIIIEDLFYNTPARKKFLATPVREMREIANMVGRIIIAHPDIRFEVRNNNKLVYISSGNGDLLQAVEAIYGHECIEHLIKLMDNDLFSGYISHPEFSRPNRNYFHFYINDRYVQSNILNDVLEEAYHTILPERRFPVCFINIKGDPKEFDINVHPNKLDVKFSDAQDISERLKDVITRTIYNSKKSFNNNAEPYSDIQKETTEPVKAFKEPGFSIHSVCQNRDAVSAPHADLPLVGLPGAVERKQRENDRKRAESIISSQAIPPFCQDVYDTESDNQHLIDKTNSGNCNTDIRIPKGKEYVDIKNKDSILSLFEGSNTINSIDDNKSEKLFNDGFYSSMDILGQVGASFIVCTNEDGLYLIDQHAAHERILYNDIKKSIKDKKSYPDPLLIPIPFNPHPRQYYWILENIILLTELGFTLEEFGESSFVIREIPFWATDIDVIAFLSELSDQCSETKDSLSPEILLERKLMTKACKRAVKANMKLTSESIKELLRLLDESEEALTCPHGRPICIHYSIDEIWKKFLRT